MTLEDLLAEREIQRTLFKVARGMDERDWTGLVELFWPDATAEIGTGPLAGSAAIIATFRRFLDVCGPTQHLLRNVLIDVEGDEARSSAYVFDRHLGLVEKARLTFATLGEYQDEWRKHEGLWRISHRRKLNHASVGDISIFQRPG